ncbi:hypothetical protein [Mucilaginibacter dorajii]|uniref:DoxX family protein n=1 Tax=Mucilaginibacter dorajii TaxID=692994 RepID=A0ABP7P4X1_9SPHI|nr:hypothetical protein [Mucilaginibacter dorajii]MCS3734463.1 putative membrane protein YkgB [Mucilaginibacter dorajii]
MIIRFIKFVRNTETMMVEWKARNGLDILRVCLSIVFIWFGVLKFFPGLSAAEVIAGKTILKLTFGHVKPAVSLPILACWECAIGLGLITKRWLSFTLVLLYFQMAGTLLPLFFFPHETWTVNIFVPTLLGQYIIKNLVLLSSGVVIGATVQGGALIASHAAATKGQQTQMLIERYRRRFKDSPVIK